MYRLSKPVFKNLHSETYFTVCVLGPLGFCCCVDEWPEPIEGFMFSVENHVV